eukprot:2310685-Lingulodinium_polyedra.AAC.1
MAARALRAGTVPLQWWRIAFVAVGADARAMDRGGPVLVSSARCSHCAWKQISSFGPPAALRRTVGDR